MKSSYKHSGLTLVEVLLGIAIMAMLLAAIAAAMHASFTSYEENRRIASMTQTARSVLQRMTRELRTADAIDSTSSQITLFPPDDGSGLERIQYDYTGGALYYRRTVSGTTTSHTLLASDGEVTISSFDVTREEGQVGEDPPYTKSVTTELVFKIGKRSFAVTSSASPRRNLLY